MENEYFEENDDIMFQTALLLHSKPRVSSLKTMCLNFIINNKQCYLKKKKGDKNRLDVLPSLLRNQMLQSFSALQTDDNTDKELSHLFVHQLLNHETTKLNLENWDLDMWKDFEDRMELMMEQTALRSPNLEFFAIVDDKIEEDNYCSGRMKTQLLFSVELESLLKLNNLKHLSLGSTWVWKNEDLRLLPNHLTQLVYLKLQLHSEVTLDAFERYPDMKNLQQLHFSVGEGDPGNFTALLYVWCAQNISSLKLVGTTFEDCQRSDDHFNDQLEDISPAISGTCHLQFLHASYYLPRASFPELTHLYLHGPISKRRTWDSLASYTNLKHLSLASGGEHSSTILKLVGNQLSHLSIIDEDNLLDVFMIVYLCPNLEEFNFIRSEPLDKESKCKYEALVTQHHFRKLKSVHLEAQGCSIPIRFLIRVFQAPLIENIIIDDVAFSSYDVRMIHYTVLHRTDFNLKSLNLMITKISFSGFEELISFIKWIVCNALVLKKIEVKLYPAVKKSEMKWQEAMQEMQRFLDVVNK